tara:strand:+ start:2293 stop:2535 length:243 start_codon:yes stop_codon:yes gene_type:complete
MLKLNNDKLFYAVKQLDDKTFAFTRSYNDDITQDKKMLAGGVVEVSAWFNDTKNNIIKDLNSCGFSEFDQLKAKQYMGLI